MNRAKALLALAIGAVPAIVAWAALLGLGMHRDAGPVAVSLGACTWLFLPPLAVAWAARDRPLALGLSLAGWSLCVLALLPVYFPGERRSAVATGLALLGGEPWAGAARAVAQGLPEEPRIARPELPVAPADVEPTLPPAMPLEAHQIALPYEGEGRRLSVPVVFQHGERSIEVDMMLDTGATYTTLPSSVLAELGVQPGPHDPEVELHTANGIRTATLVLIDAVWLGDLLLEGVAVATCEQCAFSDTVGLLGLNVASGFNMTIDADRREVVFSSRDAADRAVDVRPFVDLDARFAQFPGGRVEVRVRLANRSGRTVARSVAEVRCGERRWAVELGSVDPFDEVRAERRLPDHEPCARYGIALKSASW